MALSTYDVISARDSRELALRLSGMLVGSTNLREGADVDGLTLIFTQPESVTVTFSGTDPLSLTEIVTQINAAFSIPEEVATYRVQIPGISGGNPGHPIPVSRLALVHAGNGVTVSETGTANAALGFPTTAGASGLQGTPITSDRIVTLIYIDMGTGYLGIIAPE